MEDYAVVLANDLVVKASNFGGIKNLKYNNQGKVTSFTFEGQKIIALFQFKSNEFLDYVDESYFEKIKEKEVQKKGNKYDGVDKKLWENFVFKKYDKLVRAQFGDMIFGLLRDSSGLCYNYHKWTFTNPYKGPSDARQAPEALASGQLCDTLIQGTHARDFFDTYKNYVFLDTEESDIRLIGEIASLLNKAGEKTTEAFLNFNLTGVDTTKFTFHNNNNQLSRDELLEYKKGLELWLKMLKKYQTEIDKLGHEEQLFIAIDVMYRHNILTLLTVDQRINILKILVEKRLLMNWYFENFSIGFVHKEDLAIHILESVTNVSDANLFLEKLISITVKKAVFSDTDGTSITTSVTLYKMLFYRMDDYGGKDNFTAFAKQLERIVLLKNNIIDQNIPPSVSIEELKSTTRAQFFWREKQPEKGPIQERIKYKIISSTEKQISIKESVWLKTKLIEQYSTSSTGVDVITGYEEVPIDLQEQIFKLDHFDLVSIHFFNNPTFIDLTSDPTYIGQHYYTYAGLIAYILEKESTKVAEDIFNATLFAISLAFGIGELAAALRSLNFARTLLGVAMITSDTALYLSDNTEFHNYLVETYGIVMAQTIVSNMRILSSIASLGANAIAGSGILKVYSREEALRLVGTGEAILKDSAAVSKMLPKEIEALNEAIKRIKKELYSVRNIPEAVDIIKNTKADVLFFKFPGLKNAINELSEFEKTAFRSKFLNLHEREVNALQSHWIGSTFATKQEIIQNSEIWIKNIKLQQYLKEGRYELISILYNKKITEGYLHKGVRYAITEEEALIKGVIEELDKAIIIANRTDDVAIIAAKTGYPEHVIQKVKNHFFKNQYLLDRGDGTLCIGRFSKQSSPYADLFGDSDLWNHFINTTYADISDVRKAEFRWMLAHEYIEGGLMERHMPYKSLIDPENMLSYDVGAHHLSVNQINYEFAPYATLGRLQVSIPPLPSQNLDNLDEILNQLINFYKLE